MDDNEKTLLLDRNYECPICDKKIKAKTVKTNVAKFVGTEMDLRPIHSNINVTKYEVVSCNHCGYTAMIKNFSTLSSSQRKLIREKIQSNFKPREEFTEDTYSYDVAIQRYKMALLCAVTKNGKGSEIGNICLKLSWLYQDLADTFDGEDEVSVAKKASLLEEAKSFHISAYDNLMNARMNEDYPIAGMNEATLDYLLAYLGYVKGEYTTAMQCLSNTNSTRGISDRLKDKCYELKQLISAKIKEEKGEDGEGADASAEEAPAE